MNTYQVYYAKIPLYRNDLALAADILSYTHVFVRSLDAVRRGDPGTDERDSEIVACSQRRRSIRSVEGQTGGAVTGTMPGLENGELATRGGREVPDPSQP